MITDGQRPLILNEIQTNIYLALKVNSLQIIILTKKYHDSLYIHMTENRLSVYEFTLLQQPDYTYSKVNSEEWCQLCDVTAGAQPHQACYTHVLYKV